MIECSGKAQQVLNTSSSKSLRLGMADTEHAHLPKHGNVQIGLLAASFHHVPAGDRFLLRYKQAMELNGHSLKGSWQAGNVLFELEDAHRAKELALAQKQAAEEALQCAEATAQEAKRAQHLAESRAGAAQHAQELAEGKAQASLQAQELAEGNAAMAQRAQELAEGRAEAVLCAQQLAEDKAETAERAQQQVEGELSQALGRLEAVQQELAKAYDTIFSLEDDVHAALNHAETWSETYKCLKKAGKQHTPTKPDVCS